MERQELCFTRLDEVFEPKSAINQAGDKGHWRVVPYRTTEFAGNALVAMEGARPQDITFAPGCTGWYRIFLQLSCIGSSCVFIKQKADPCFDYVTPGRENWDIQEMFWRCADMTGEELTITMRKAAEGQYTMLTGIRLVPMTDEEIREYQHRHDGTRCLYTANDMHNLFYCTTIEEIDDTLAAVCPYENSDAEWVAFEEIRHFASGLCPTDPDDFAFYRNGDRNLQKQLPRFDYDEVLRRVCAIARSLGIRPVISMRMGASGLCFPYNKCYFDDDFALSHPELHCVDRDGRVIPHLSYAFPEVRARWINDLVHDAQLGCDALCLIFHRAPPFTLYEKPFADLFRARYGEDPYVYPLDDPRINTIHCEIMTTFFRELRQALDNSGNRHVEIHIRGQYSIHDCKAVGLDCEQLLREGLVNAITSFPQRVFEVFEDSVWADETHTRLDIDRFRDSSFRGGSKVEYWSDGDFPTQYKNSRGQLVGPESGDARIREWVALERKYGVPVYIEIFPRCMEVGLFREKIRTLYDAGITHISLWDTYSRIWNRPMWNAIRDAGNPETVRTVDLDTERNRTLRIVDWGGMDIGRYNPIFVG